MSKEMRTAVLALLVGTALGLGSIARADPIGPGFDLFATFPVAEVTVLLPGGPTTIQLIGHPVDPEDIGNTDTIVRRNAGIDPFPAPGGVGSIPIEIVALSLQSVAPVEVFPGSFFDVNVTLAPGPQPVGNMAISHDNLGGGTFTSTLPVNAQITFLGPSLPPFTVLVNDTLFGGGRWSHTAPPLYPNVPFFPSGGFFPGVILEQGQFAIHPVVPAQVPPPAPEFSDKLFGMPNFGWISSLGGGLLGLAVIRRRHSR